MGRTHLIACLSAFLTCMMAHAEIEYRVTHIDVARTRFYQEMTFVLGPRHAVGQTSEVSEETTRNLALEIYACESKDRCELVGTTKYVSIGSRDSSWNLDGSDDMSVTIQDADLERKVISGQVQIKAVVQESGWILTSPVAQGPIVSSSGFSQAVEGGYGKEDCPFLIAELKGLGGIHKIDCRFTVEVTPFIR